MDTTQTIFLSVGVKMSVFLVSHLFYQCWPCRMLTQIPWCYPTFWLLVLDDVTGITWSFEHGGLSFNVLVSHTGMTTAHFSEGLHAFTRLLEVLQNSNNLQQTAEQ